MRWIVALVLCNLVTLQAARAEGIALKIGEHSILAEVANTPQSREHGMMQKSQLCGNCGMLFVFPRAGKYSFWMKNTLLPLSIAFIAADGSILNIDEMQANTTQSHFARDNVLYALEMNKDWFAERSIRLPAIVQGLPHAPAGQ